MSWLHKRTYTKAARFQPSALAGIQPHHVADYLKWRAYGTTDVDFKDLEQNPTCPPLLLSKKKAIPSTSHQRCHIEWNLRQTNQVRSCERSGQEVKKAETQHRGKKSCATRDLTERVSQGGSFESTIPEVHLITRTDDISKLKYSTTSRIQIPFCAQLQGALVQEYFGRTKCPDQIILGRWIPTFVLCSDGELHGGSFNYGYGALVGKMHSSYSRSDPSWLPSTASSLPQHSQAVFLSAPFLAVALLIAGVLGSHSIRSLLQLWQEGWVLLLTKLHSRSLEGRLSGRVVDAYISPEQPWIDLCMGAPIAYKLHPDAKRHVVPRTHRGWSLPSKMRTTHQGRCSCWRQPWVKVPLSILTHNTKLHINEIEPMDTGGGGGTAGGTTGRPARQALVKLPIVAAGDGMQTQHSTNERGDSDKDYCAAQPAPAVDGNLFRNWLTVERTRRNGQTSLRYRQLWPPPLPAKLAKYRTVGSAWQEWVHGIGGKKPAKNFMAFKSTYSRRKPLWTLMKAPAWVISRLRSITKEVFEYYCCIKQDTIMGSLHEDLCIVRAQ
ncbi:unknown protein [Seminavis robusta]|uniref:Uncharacterized protein n=1 Tax=Seminavis robusta TaxID=568900 RepID=A0A9N8EGX9_9STRA|nr:unknown protein [Seminavis robusta]